MNNYFKKKYYVREHLTMLFHSVRPLSKHVDDLVISARIRKKDIGFTKPQIYLSDTTSQMIKTLHFSISIIKQ